MKTTGKRGNNRYFTVVYIDDTSEYKMDRLEGTVGTWWLGTVPTEAYNPILIWDSTVPTFTPLTLR